MGRISDPPSPRGRRIWAMSPMKCELLTWWVLSRVGKWRDLNTCSSKVSASGACSGCQTSPPPAEWTSGWSENDPSCHYYNTPSAISSAFRSLVRFLARNLGKSFRNCLEVLKRILVKKIDKNLGKNLGKNHGSCLRSFTWFFEPFL